eukprot:766653-Hanusia_phi.AAC.10
MKRSQGIIFLLLFFSIRARCFLVHPPPPPGAREIAAMAKASNHRRTGQQHKKSSFTHHQRDITSSSSSMEEFLRTRYRKEALCEERIGGNLSSALEGIGWTYGSCFGPSPERTWAAEAVLAASLRDALSSQQPLTSMGLRLGAVGGSSIELEQCDGGGEEEEEILVEEGLRFSDRAAVVESSVVVGDEKTGGGRGFSKTCRSYRARQIVSSDAVQDVCKVLVSHIFKVIRVMTKSPLAHKEGLLLEVHNSMLLADRTRKRGKHHSSSPSSSSSSSPHLTFLDHTGDLVTFAISEVDEISVCSLGGSEDFLVMNFLSKLSLRGVDIPKKILDDHHLIILRALAQSIGRHVLYQNLRHTLLGFSAYRSLWTDFLTSQEEDAAPDSLFSSLDSARRGWLVKVKSDVEAYSRTGSGRSKWVPVEEVLPMSEYDLDVYGTYRHELHPSSEFDLQRHDSLLHRRYMLSASKEELSERIG